MKKPLSKNVKNNSHIHGWDGPPSRLHCHVPSTLAFSVIVVVSPLVEVEPLTEILVAKNLKECYTHNCTFT